MVMMMMMGRNYHVTDVDINFDNHDGEVGNDDDNNDDNDNYDTNYDLNFDNDDGVKLVVTMKIIKIMIVMTMIMMPILAIILR
jgi:hypothetical protein